MFTAADAYTTMCQKFKVREAVEECGQSLGELIKLAAEQGLDGLHFGTAAYLKFKDPECPSHLYLNVLGTYLQEAGFQVEMTQTNLYLHWRQ